MTRFNRSLIYLFLFATEAWAQTNSPVTVRGQTTVR